MDVFFVTVSCNISCSYFLLFNVSTVESFLQLHLFDEHCAAPTPNTTHAAKTRDHARLLMPLRALNEGKKWMYQTFSKQPLPSLGLEC